MSQPETELIDYVPRVPIEAHLCSREMMKEVVLTKAPKNLIDPYVRQDYETYLDFLDALDFERDLIMSSTRTQRRKIIILKLFHQRPQSQR